MSVSEMELSCGCATCLGATNPSLSGADYRVAAANAAVDEPAETPIAVNSTTQGEINTEGDTDVYTVTLTAGQSYMISLRTTGATQLDTFLSITDSLGAQLASDDDGGTGTNSMITFTPTVTGTYKISAEAFDNASQVDIGSYTLDVRQMGSDSVGGTIGTAAPLAIGGTHLDFLETDDDVDMFAVTLVAGRLYTFEVAGGADYNTSYLNVPQGEIDTILTLYDAAGNVVAENDDINFSSTPGSGDISSALGYAVSTGGTYYLKVGSYGNAAGYALLSNEIDLSTRDPIDSIDWGSQLPSTAATVYFAGPGEIYDGVASLGWTDYEIRQAMAAFQTWADVTNLSFTRTTDASTATFKLVTTSSADYLGYFNPPGTPNQGVGVFAVNGTGWDRTGTQGGLDQGGYGWITLIHEFGHGIGLAHPHDNGGTSEIMPGVTGPFGSYGAFDLNQGVYTTMSYNDGWQTHPDAVSGSPPGNPTTWGYQGGPGAFDIAAVQAKYGADSGRNAGDNVYTLPTANAPGTFWTTIWDVGGTDTIAHQGTISARIDLTAATLDYTPTGAGVVSFASGVFGGFTIANAVVIENATGGSAADTLIGNSAENLLDGRGGADTMIGRGGDDIYVVDDAGDVVQEVVGGGYDEVRTTLASYTLGDQLERLRAANDIAHDFRANDLSNVIIGGAGNDVFRLQDGGDDVVFAGDGVDSLYFGAAFAATDYVDGGANRDGLLLQGDYSAGLTFGIGTTSNIVNVESISLVSGLVAAYGDTAGNLYSYNLTLLDSNVAAGGLMKINGSRLEAGENLTFDGSAETNASLQIFAGLGTDHLIGGQMNDNFIFIHDGRFGAGDTVVGGGGYDVVYLRGDYVIDFNLAGFAGALSGVESIGLLTSANTEFASGGDGEFDYSITWNDALLATGATMTVNGGRLGANETFLFNGASETNGTLRVFGGAAADTLTTGGGNDLIYGGGGADQLRGNGGADTFRYQETSDSTGAAFDTILDFTSGTDRIDLDKVDAKSATTDANEAFAFIGDAAFTAAGQLRAFNVSGNLWQVEGDVNGDGVADLVIQVNVEAGQPLVAGDFLF